MTKIQSLRSRAFHAQQERCFYCNLPMWNDDVRAFARRFRITVRQARANRCTAEHLRARCDGGQDSAENVVAACFDCNATRHRRKKPLLAEKWQLIRARRALRGGLWKRDTDLSIS